MALLWPLNDVYCLSVNTRSQYSSQTKPLFITTFKAMIDNNSCKILVQCNIRATTKHVILNACVLVKSFAVKYLPNAHALWDKFA